MDMKKAVRGIRCAILAGLLALAMAPAGACGGSTTSSRGTPPTPPVDAGSECDTNLQGDCWTGCKQDAGNYCAGDCFQSWPASDAAVCAMYPSADPQREDCGGYRALNVPHVNSRTTYYYDTATGALVRRVAPEASLRNRRRLAGKPWFVLPVVGPRRARVTAIELGHQRVAWPPQGTPPPRVAPGASVR